MNISKKMTTLTAVAISLFGWSMVHASSIAVFNQDFSSSSTVGDYDNGGANQFDAIGGTGATSSITGGALKFNITEGSGNIGHASRSVTDFTGTSAGVVKFTADISASFISTSAPPAEGGNNLVRFQFGNALNSTTATANSATYSMFSLNKNNNADTFYIVTPSNLSTAGFSSGDIVSVTYFINNSDAPSSVTAPDGSTLVLANDFVSLWVGNTLIETRAAEDPAQTIDNFGFYARSDVGPRNLAYDLTVDNINISVIPEPSTFSLIGLALVVLGIVGKNNLNLLGSSSRVR